MVCGTLQTVLDQNPPLFGLLTGTTKNQGCKEKAEKIDNNDHDKPLFTLCNQQ